MSENPISISMLNDFIFCPVSIYFHSLETDEKVLYQDAAQINGTYAHKNSDTGAYSSKKNMLQGVSVFCQEFNIYGKIDIFDIENAILTERKKKIKTIYDGYVFQLYAQYYALEEMGYKVKSIRLYSMDDNKTYPIRLPNENQDMLKLFKELILNIQNFSFDEFVQDNVSKCENCIYEPLLQFFLFKGGLVSC